MNILIIGAGVIGMSRLVSLVERYANPDVIVNAQELVQEKIEEQDIDPYLIQSIRQTIFIEEKPFMVTLRKENYVKIAINTIYSFCFSYIILPILQLDWTYG